MNKDIQTEYPQLYIKKLTGKQGHISVTAAVIISAAIT